MKLGIIAIAAAAALLAPEARAYPGGTPIQQTDAAPFCAGCHAVRAEAAVASLPEARAAKELAEQKHLAVIEAGAKGYGELTPEQRKELVAHIRALDEASSVTLEAPAQVAKGETFTVTVTVTGGAGPVVGVALVDGDDRFHARPAPSAGWAVVGAPEIKSGDGPAQTAWLEKRSEAAGRNLAFVNVAEVASDAKAGTYGKATVTWTLRAPPAAGTHPLAAVFLYGTEKATPLGHTVDPVRGKQVRGGFTGGSGRIVFTPVQSIEVQ